MSNKPTRFQCVPKIVHRQSSSLVAIGTLLGIAWLTCAYGMFGSFDVRGSSLGALNVLVICAPVVIQCSFLVVGMVRWDRIRARFRELQKENLLPCANCDYLLYPLVARCSECGWARIISEQIWDRFMKRSITGTITVDDPLSDDPAISFSAMPAPWWQMLAGICVLGMISYLVVRLF